MKISICIPQYNRIQYLLKSLKQIELQNYANIEIVVSDDCSSDNTEIEIKKLQQHYKYPLIYRKNETNLGYDSNYRRSIELSSGDYCVVIGNDDTINTPQSIEFLVDFLSKNDQPEIGFCNFIEENAPEIIIERAQSTTVLGSGPNVALQYYSCFSFVGGLIYKKTAFNKYNTSKHDGSIYAQMYIGCLMIASGCRLFSIKEALVVKDITGEAPRSSYRQTIAKKWKDYKVVNGGMPSVINVLISAFKDAEVLTQKIQYKIFKHIYALTFPHWILDYKSNKAFPEATGLIVGMNPVGDKNFKSLNVFNRTKIFTQYLFSSLIGIAVPAAIFKKYKNKIYKFFKRR